MCVGAMVHARIVYGASDPGTGACGSIMDLPAVANFNHYGRFDGGVLARECFPSAPFCRVSAGGNPRRILE